MKFLKKYKNGLTLVYEGNTAIRSASIGVFVKTGSVNENAKNNGISHFIEHNMFKGTEKRTQFDIVAETDSIGAAINAFTSKTTTCYYIQCVDTDFRHSAEILSDMFFNSVFPETELNKEKSVVLEEIAMCNDTPDDLSYEIATSAFYKGHPFSKRILGTKNNVSGFTRSDILDYINQRYTADNTIISICGNVSENEVLETVDEYFASKFTRIKSKKNKIAIPNTQSVFVNKFKKIEQGNINILMPSVAYDAPNAHATRIFNSSFGYGMSGRLYQQIREKLGLAYSVYSYLSMYENSGHSMIYLGTNVQNIEKALSAVKSEVEKVTKYGLSEEEFLRGKAQVKSSLVYGLEGSVNVMNMLGKHCARTGTLADIDNMLLDIDAVTLDDVNEAGRNSFDLDKATVGYIGPKYDKNLLDLLKN